VRLMRDAPMRDRTTTLPINFSHTRFGRSALARTALILIGVLAAGPVAAVRAVVPVPAFNVTAVTNGTDTGYGGLGYIFTTSQALDISALGLRDPHGNEITATNVPISLYYSNAANPTPGATWTGGGGHTGGEFIVSDA